MQVVHTLTGLGTLVDDQAVAVAADSTVASDLVGEVDHAEEQWRLLRLVVLGDHQDMRRRNRPDVLEGQHVVAPLDLFGGRLLSPDLAEEALLRHQACSPSASGATGRTVASAPSACPPSAARTVM